MSNVVSDAVSAATAAPKAVAGWAKAKPWVFVAFCFLLVVLAVRYRNQVVRFLTGVNFLGIGQFMARVLGVTSTAALLMLIPLRADAAQLGGMPTTTGGWIGLGLGALVVVALLCLRLLRGDAGPAFSVFFPKEDTLDLRTPDGSTSVAITPGAAEQTVQFKITGDKGSFAGGWMKATGITFKNTFVFDQAAAGGSAVFWDELPRVIAGLEILHPLWGTMLAKETGSGPILKHLIEFIGSGYEYAGDGARAVIASTDGDTTCDLYVTYPIAQKCMVRPTDQACWIGWLDQTLLNFTQAISTRIADVSTGAVIKTPCTVKAGLDYIIDNHLEIPTIAYWARYTHNAGSELIRALGLGKGGPQNTKLVERLVGIYELFNVFGFGATTTSDNVLAVFCEQLGLTRVTNVDFIVKNYLKLLGPVRGPKGGNGTSALHALAGNPYTMGATPSNALNISTLGYLALRAPGLRQEITKVPKFAGDLMVTQTYTTTPSSGSHILVVQSIREFVPEMRKELLGRANRAGASENIPLADGTPLTPATAKKNGGARGLHGLPRSID